MGQERIVLELPWDTKLALPAGHWRRVDGLIVAEYTRHELAVAVGLGLEQKRATLEGRLVRGLEVLAGLTNPAAPEAQSLRAHWDRLNAEHAGVAEQLRAVLAEW